jgi:hypothetical protein
VLIRGSGLAVALAVIMSALVDAQNAAKPTTVGGCPAEPAAFHACALEKAKTFSPPRTRSGKPDLQGYWRGQLAQSFSVEGVSGNEPLVGSRVMPWAIAPAMIVDPPDRKIPYQPWALEFRKTITERFISPLASCLPPGIPRDIVAPAAHQIVQTPGYVMHLLEYSHAYRVIPITNEPHTPGTVKLWQGNSRGHWEGNTLVVDVANLNGLAWFDNAGNFASDALHVVERYTMIDRDAIYYEARIEDPKVYMRPWTMVSALTRNKEPGFEIWEQACHEGNQSVADQLRLGLKPFPGVTSPR